MLRIRSRPLLVLLLILVATGCAARGARAKTQIAALTVGEAVLALDDAERQVFAAKVQGYGQAEHDRVSPLILKVLYASRGFGRAAASWPEGVSTPPAALDAASEAVRVALADVEAALPAASAAREPLLKAIATIRAALAAWRAA